MKPLFSVVTIMKNEERSLPRLAASLRNFLDRGGKWISVDTGSTDNSIELARSLGCEVYEEGGRFLKTIDQENADKINTFFESDVVKEGDSLFDYSEARNYSTSLSPTEWVWCIDIDEQATTLSIDRINEIISDDSLSRLEYQFVFSHKEDGTSGLQFMHSKFYRRDRMRWTCVVHEVLEDIGGETKAQYVDESVIFLEHFQIPSDHRSSYLKGLAWDCYFNQDKDRQSHYMARELMTTGRYVPAIKEFKRHIAMNKWPAERAQSMIYMGHCYKFLGEHGKAEEAYHQAMQVDPARREPFFALGEMFHELKDWQRSAIYFRAALEIPYHGGFYATDMSLYQDRIHLLQSVNYYFLDRKSEALQQLLEAYKHNPNEEIIISNFKYLIDFPPVSIIIPRYKYDTDKLEKSLQEDEYFGEKEILIEEDMDGIGCPSMVNTMVKEAKHNFIVYLGQDTTVTKHWLNHAIITHRTTFKDDIGITALNDGIHLPDWHPKLACHFLAHKKILPFLEDGTLFSTSFKHYCVDDYLTLQCMIHGKLAYASNAIITHDNSTSESKEKGSSTREVDTTIYKQKSKILEEKYGYTS